MTAHEIAHQLDRQIATLEEVKQLYAGRTIDNIIENLKSRRQCYPSSHNTTSNG